MLEALARFASTCLGYFPTLVLMWLALFFGRTLRPGEMPLIERIARVGKPNPSQRLVRYTRGLTALWCAYFVIAAVLTVAGHLGFRAASLGVASVSATLFIVENWIRRLILFRNEPFPGVVQQLRDTVSVWRPSR